MGQCGLRYRSVRGDKSRQIYLKFARMTPMENSIRRMAWSPGLPDRRTSDEFGLKFSISNWYSSHCSICRVLSGCPQLPTFVGLSNVCLFVILPPPNTCSAIHLYKISRKVARCTSAPFGLNMSFECQILRAVFPYYVSRKLLNGYFHNLLSVTDRPSKFYRPNMYFCVQLNLISADCKVVSAIESSRVK